MVKTNTKRITAPNGLQCPLPHGTLTPSHLHDADSNQQLGQLPNQLLDLGGNLCLNAQLRTGVQVELADIPGGRETERGEGQRPLTGGVVHANVHALSMGFGASAGHPGIHCHAPHLLQGLKVWDVSRRALKRKVTRLQQHVGSLQSAIKNTA